MQPFGPTEKAIFLDRPNRFTLLCRLHGKAVKAFLPNPGRLWELLLPGARVYLERVVRPNAALPYTAVAIEKGNRPVMVHTQRANDLVESLLRRDLIPSLEGAEILKREASHGRSRFDFLLQKATEKIILEVKSCTLFGERVAMFPDAVTLRGKRHLEELADLSREGMRGAVLFLIGTPSAEHFLPEYHTDFEFSRALLAARRRLTILPLAVEWSEDLLPAPQPRLLHIPWDLVEREARDRGSYILLLRLPKRIRLPIGRLGTIPLRPGYYLYVGSARANLTQRIGRHRRLRKRSFWHVDYLRAHTHFRHALPIRSQEDLECQVAEALREISDWSVPGFGSSDCSCLSHLFGMKKDPLRSPDFLSLLQYFRMDRLFAQPAP
ncbi:MAG: DNA/RNA nuclease SfsA [candidate division NC10 bacterium]|nr:DNA/RNA nuclease SfsA [candidate division NC10 bacterium]